jgi:hypothetical protein
MHIAKLRVRDETGLVPAGRYFEQLAKNLRTANAREDGHSVALVTQNRLPRRARRIANSSAHDTDE